MAYTKTNWQDNVTPLSAQNMNKIEQGIADAHTAANTVQNNLTNHISDYVRQPGYAAATGSANAYAVTLNPAPAALVEGMAVAIKINVDNTGASTLNVNGLGAKPIKKPNGNDVAAGNLKAGSVYTLRYNGANFILQGEGGSGTAQPADVLSGKTFTNDTGEQVGTMPNRTGHVTGQSISRSGTTLRIRPQPGYYPGDAANSVQWNDPNWVAQNIREGVSIFGVNGSIKNDWILDNVDIPAYTTREYLIPGIPLAVIVTGADVNDRDLNAALPPPLFDSYDFESSKMKVSKSITSVDGETYTAVTIQTKSTSISVRITGTYAV